MSSILNDDVASLLLAASLRLSFTVALGLALLSVLQTSRPWLHRCVWSSVLLQSLWLAPFVIPLPCLKSTPSGPPDLGLPGIVELGLHQASPLTFVSTAGQPPASLRFTTVIETIWLTGLAATLGLLWFSQVVVWRMVSTSVPARQAWQRQLEELARRRGCRTKVRLRTHPTLGPLLARSWGGYCVIVPRGTWQAFSQSERAAILLHELTHLQRGDVWKSVLMRCAASVHWFNPLSWWAVAKFDEAAEWACDAEVRRLDAGLATSLAAALLRLTKPQAVIRLGASMARGSRIGVRVRRLLNEIQHKETNMKKLLVLGFVGSILVAGMVRFQLVVQDLGTRHGPRGNALETEFIGLQEALQHSQDTLVKQLQQSLESEAGKLMLMDLLSERALQVQAKLRGDIVRDVLHEHFQVTGKVAEPIDASDPILQELKAAGTRSTQDIQGLAEACRRIADRLHGDDEATLLVKRFLTEETGPAFLYIHELRDRMQPGIALLADTLGRALALNSDGKYSVRPDAREKVSAMAATRESALQLQQRLQHALMGWSDELTNGDKLHDRIQACARNPLFAARFVADQIFERQELNAQLVNEIPDKLDEMSVDTSRGLMIHAQARADLTQVIDEFEAVLPRVEVIRSVLAELVDKIADSDAVNGEFKKLLQTDMALVALAKEAKLANATPEQLVLSLIGDALDDSGGQLRLTENEEVRDQVSVHIQDAFRELRAARRRAQPVRELAGMIRDPELSAALTSVGGMLVIRRLVEEKMGEAEHAAYEQWKHETFEELPEGLSIRQAARAQVGEFLARVRELEKELADNDF